MNALLVALLLSATPEMGLTTVTPGQDSLITTQNALNTDLAIIDGHNHSSGEGVVVNPAGINIQAALPMNGWPDTLIGYSGYVDAGAGPSIPMSAWFNGQDFCVELGNGQKVCLTCNGTVCSSIGDGGSFTAGTVTASCFVNTAGVRVCSSCVQLPNGATLCGSSGPADINLNAFDGGIINLNVGGTANLEVQSTEVYSPVPVVADGFDSNAGAYVTAGFPVGFDTVSNGNITEVGTNLVVAVPDGGEAIVSCEVGSPYCLRVVYDAGGGASGIIASVQSNGDAYFGNTTSAEGVTLTHGAAGVGYVTIGSYSAVDPNVAMYLAPRGDGGIILGGHLDSYAANGTPTVSTEASTLTGCWDAGFSLVAGSTDTVGTITVTTGSNVCQISGNVSNTEPILTFSKAYSGASSYVVIIQPTAAFGTVQPQTPGITQEAGDFVLSDWKTFTPTGSRTYNFNYITMGAGFSSH